MQNGISLYTLGEIYSQLPAKLEGEVSEQELQEYLDSLEIQIEDKVKNVFAYSKNLELYGNAIEDEIKRLKDLKKGYINRAEALKKYISYCMLKNGIKSVDTKIARFSFLKSTAVNIVNEELIPEQFMVTKTTVQPDKTAIKKAIKAGEEVPGALLDERDNLQIR